MARPSQDSQPSKKRKSTDSASDAQPSSKRQAKFSYLKPQTKHISQDLVRSEWKSLPKPAQQQVRDIFLAAKRTTLNQILDGPRRREAEFVVNDVLRRLERQLPRMPFPPGTKKEMLDLDGILENVRTMEAEKMPLVDSVKLIEEEIEREDQRIDLKRQGLAKLEREAKAASKLRKQHAAKTHTLLEDMPSKATAFDDAESIGLVAPKSRQLDFDEDDADIAPLLTQLQSHLDSIKANMEQLADVDVEMLRTRAAVTALLPEQVT